MNELIIFYQDDCLSPSINGFDLTTRSHYFISIYNLACTQTYDCPKPVCEDTTCAIESKLSFIMLTHIITGNACLGYCGHLNWVYQSITQNDCIQENYCNWNSSLCTDMDANNCNISCTNNGAASGRFTCTSNLI